MISGEKGWVFFMRFLLLPVSGRVQGQEQLSHSARAVVFPSLADQEALGTMEIKLRWPLIVQESFRLGQNSGKRSGFILSELVPLPKLAVWKQQHEIESTATGSKPAHLHGMTQRLETHLTCK